MPERAGRAALAPALALVAPGVYRLAVPVPYRGLGTVNAYLLPGPEGWAVVDTGARTAAAVAVWQAALEALGHPRLARIVVTHHHPDHLGLAGWLHARTGADVFMPEQEIATLTTRWMNPRRDRSLKAFFARCGAPPALAFTRADVAAMERSVAPLPAVLHPLHPGEHLVLGTRRFEALASPGHTDGHLMLWHAPDGLLLAGDHVLPHITPTIGAWPGAAPDPLGRYLGTLGALHALPVRRALPGHGSAFAAWAARLEALAAHHAARLAEAAEAAEAARGATAYDVAAALFALDRLGVDEQRFALTEALAHLDHLVARGRLRRQNGRGPWRFYPP